ncbi:putative mitochondrial carrier protein [Diaporthe ampelina]|uniref:Putative mitochondrial carrier protein n=1 Tax=Diaporthe ampelina TaxID=1214573 RepID=A0A0G2IGQ4_9PEZI|nr:putative mitochondrial carrier protein [Diaporthe ampelina]
MSADFWAGYISGAVGIVIGNPLDILKVRLQASNSAAGKPSSTAPSASPAQPSPSSITSALSLVRKFSTGTAAPILGYGALNALLFVSYNRSEEFLNRALSPHGSSHSSPNSTGSTTGSNLWTTFLAGAIGGLATWVVSTPTELVKCRAQLSNNPQASSWDITKRVLRTEGGVRGLYFGGSVTALRDSVGYGFYFWSYELTTRWMEQWSKAHEGQQGGVFTGSETAKVLLCGGLAGIVTWASIFPLDVIKTRVQAQVLGAGTIAVVTGESSPLLQSPAPKRLGAIEIARDAYKEGGLRVFFRGLAVCSVRAFIVNAVQWATYEWIMMELGQGRKRPETISS